ncbi:hypothetical protein [Haloferula sp.]|uniref:hypothetical protein n=1 Tax=Haloferula sp. TaxID=2497595 RepID=UPI003C781A5F
MPIFARLFPSDSQADVRLLPINTNNNAHRSFSRVNDVLSDGTHMVFVTGPPSSGATPGISPGET